MTKQEKNVISMADLNSALKQDKADQKKWGAIVFETIATTNRLNQKKTAGIWSVEFAKKELNKMGLISQIEGKDKEKADALIKAGIIEPNKDNAIPLAALKCYRYVTRADRFVVCVYWCMQYIRKQASK